MQDETKGRQGSRRREDSQQTTGSTGNPHYSKYSTVQYSTVQYSCCESDIEHTGVERVLLYKVSNPVLKTTCCERDDIIIEITNLHYYAYVIATLAS